MASQAKVRPPFVWLGNYTAAVSVLSAVAIGAFFRFFQIGSLPPGLHSGSATVGLQALDLIEHAALPGLNAANGYAPVWVLLQAVSIKLLGHTELALNLWPAIVGTLAILTTWLWLRSWFGLRIAWLASFLLAVTPWAVTLSRGGSVAAIFPLLTSLTLWVATRAWRQRTTGSGLALAAVFVLDLFAGPVGWLLIVTSAAIALVLLFRSKQLLKLDPARIAAAAGLTVGLAGFGYLVDISLGAVKALPQTAGLAYTIGSFGSGFVRTLLMFNVTGDENYRHNLAGEPLLNAFVGLMFVAGILIGISRLHERRYRLLFVYFIMLLLPALLTSVGVPNAARAAATLPIVLALAAVGISYMLELWYRTFPINSAARVTGQAAIIVLLGLSMFQGYTQYFRAWANTGQVYVAYNEGAGRMAQNILVDKKFAGDRYVVATPDEQPVVSYLVHGAKAYTPLQAKDVAALPITPGTRKFIISAASREEAVKSLKLKFPGGVLRPLLSDFNQAEICYIYEVTK
jgi:hypothetical protein